MARFQSPPLLGLPGGEVGGEIGLSDAVLDEEAPVGDPDKEAEVDSAVSPLAATSAHPFRPRRCENPKVSKARRGPSNRPGSHNI